MFSQCAPSDYKSVRRLNTASLNVVEAGMAAAVAAGYAVVVGVAVAVAGDVAAHTPRPVEVRRETSTTLRAPAVGVRWAAASLRGGQRTR